MSKMEVAGLSVGEHIIGLTACDIYAAYSKHRQVLKIIETSEVWQPLGDQKHLIVNSAYFLRSMLEELGFEPVDIEKAMGSIGSTKIL